MRTIDKIKDLIVKLGGTPSEKPRVNDQLDKLCGCSFGAKSYNDLNDKPFETIPEIIVEWDNEIKSGMTVVDYGVDSTAMKQASCKISDYIPTINQIKNSKTEMFVPNTGIVDYPEANSYYDMGDHVVLNAYCFIIRTPNLSLKVSGGEYRVFPETGIYMEKLRSDQIYFSKITFPEEIVPLDEKYIPRGLVNIVKVSKVGSTYKLADGWTYDKIDQEFQKGNSVIINDPQTNYYYQCTTNTHYANGSKAYNFGFLSGTIMKQVQVYADGGVYVLDGQIKLVPQLAKINGKQIGTGLTLTYEDIGGTAITLNSSTEGSTKKFKLTVDDSGTITATEITE